MEQERRRGVKRTKWFKSAEGGNRRRGRRKRSIRGKRWKRPKSAEGENRKNRKKEWEQMKKEEKLAKEYRRMVLEEDEGGGRGLENCPII